MAEKGTARRLNLFGVALDPTDDELKLAFKAILGRKLAAGGLRFKNPYEAVASSLQDMIDQGSCEICGEIEVPSWLTPAPGPSDLPLVTAENNLRFLDGGGCLDAADRVKAFIDERLAGGIPAMIAVDHSMTGGALRALAERHGSSNVTVLVVDSHFDGLRLAERMDLFRCAQGNPLGGGCGRPAGDRPSTGWTEGGAGQESCNESYNCATWLRHVLDTGAVRPENLIVFGVSDYPTEAMRQDARLRRYVESYLGFERRGVAFVNREEIRQRGVRDALEPLLRDCSTDFLYVSLDADVGSLKAVHAARFMNVVGLNAEELYRLARVLEGVLRERWLIGLDVSGIETFLLGREFPNGVKDRTLERLSDFVRVLLGRPPQKRGWL